MIVLLLAYILKISLNLDNIKWTYLAQRNITFVGLVSEQHPLNNQGLFVAPDDTRGGQIEADMKARAPPRQSVPATITFLNVPTCLHADEKETAITITERIVS